MAPVVIGILLLGYYLDAEATRGVWMPLAGLTILAGIVALLIVGAAGNTRGK